MTTDTPRTDAAAIRCACSTYVVPSEFARELERENAALRAISIEAMISNTAFRMKELERENTALREALASAENGLRHGLMMEPVDPFQRGKVISWALDTVRAALKKEAQP